MPQTVIKWEYDRKPKTSLYTGKMKVYQLKKNGQLGPMVYEQAFLEVQMPWMLEALHEVLQKNPTADVLAVRTQPETQFHKERTVTVPLPRDLVDLIRDNPGEARKHFEPVVVRSEERQ